MKRRNGGHYRFWGILFILVGSILIIDAANIMDIGDIFSRYWPMILVAIGISLITRRQKNPIGGSVLILLGIYFQLQRLEWLYYPYNVYFFSGALILLGVILLLYPSFLVKRTEGLSANSSSEKMEKQS